MRSLDLNLASHPFRNNTLLWVGYALLAVLVVGFTAWNTVTFVDTRGALDQLRNTVGSVEGRLSAVDQRERTVEGRIAKHDVKHLATRASRANEFIRRKAFSWTRLFNVLEAIQPYEVKMVSVRPLFGSVAGGGTLPAGASATDAGVPVSVDGVAKSVDAFFDFEDALIDDPHIDRIEPMRSSRTKSGEILFSLSFLYYPDGLEKKADPGQAAALRAASAVTDDADEAPDAPEAKAPAPADAPAAADVAPKDEIDPGRRPMFKSTGKHTVPDKPEAAREPPPKKGDR